MRSLGIFLLVMWIALANVGVGFALAVCFGHGPQRWPKWNWARRPNFTVPWRLLKWRRRRVDVAPDAVDEFVTIDVALAQLQEEVASVRGDNGRRPQETTTSRDALQPGFEQAEPKTNLKQLSLVP